MRIKGALFVNSAKEIINGIKFLDKRCNVQWSIIDNTDIDTSTKHSGYIYNITLKNGDSWDIMPVVANCCGKRYNVVLYDKNINNEIINRQILPLASIGIGLSFPVDIYEEEQNILSLNDINYII